ncbi:MAG: hypothetical protein V5A38_05430 [Halolamina sp.]|uniref:hypothetical protein n=1 Tax=Halolamina sp. TaxID=1940283 RepID=UPI002FC2DD2A
MAYDPRTDRSRPPSSTADEPNASQEGSALRPIIGEFRGTLHRSVDSVSIRGQALWALVIVSMALDIALTRIGLSLGLRERNPIALVFIDSIGLLGAALVLKGCVLVVALANWLLLPRLYPSQSHRRYLIPLAVALPSWATVGVNAVLILSVL